MNALTFINYLALVIILTCSGCVSVPVVVDGKPTGKSEWVPIWNAKQKMDDAIKDIKPETITKYENPTDEQIAQHSKAKLFSSSLKLLYIGGGFLIAGFIISTFIANVLIRKVGDWVFMAGGGLTLWGLWLMGIAKYLNWFIGATILIIIAFTIMRIRKNKGFLKPKQKEPEADV